MTEKEIFELFDLYGTDMGDYYEIEVGRIERLVKEIEFQSAPKELSDEEIKAIANNLTCTPDKNWNVLFAREILKKASEK
jgi:hypothetical protein